MKTIQHAIMVLFFFGAYPLNASASELPHYLNFQTEVYDDSGRLAEDEYTDVTFCLVDQDEMETWCEIHESVPVLEGSISVNIGNGINPSTLSHSGGVPVELLDPKAMHQLKYQFNNWNAAGPFPFLSMPYALYSEKALSLAKDTVGSEQIINGSIRLEDLSPIEFTSIQGTISDGQIPENIIRSEALEEHESANAAHHASQIETGGTWAVASGFDVESVLRSIDDGLRREVLDRKKKHSDLNVGLTESIELESALRLEQDLELQASIVSNSSSLTNYVDTEATNRQTADDGLSTSISNEATTRQNADTSILNSISSETTSRQSEDNSIHGRIDGVVADLTSHLSLPSLSTSDLGAIAISSIVIAENSIETRNNSTGNIVGTIDVSCPSDKRVVSCSGRREPECSNNGVHDRCGLKGAWPINTSTCRLETVTPGVNHEIFVYAICAGTN